jgi:hypothetical protein
LSDLPSDSPTAIHREPLTPLCVIEDLPQVRTYVLQRLVAGSIQLPLYHLQAHGMLDRLVIIRE